MALGEQFLSRSITHMPTGARGTRVFLELWQDRYKAGLPYIGEQWPDDNMNPWTPSAPEGLWVHEIIPTPYAASGDESSANDVATHVKLEYIYEASKPLTSDPAGWLISSNATIQTVEIGRERKFESNPEHKLDAGKVMQVAVTEVVIRGLEYLGANLSTRDLVLPTVAARGRLGLACSNILLGMQTTAQVLFTAEDTGEPFMRRSCRPAEIQPIAWYREYSRRFLLKYVEHYVDPHTTVIVGHNMEWDSQAQAWDTVLPWLYDETDFEAGIEPIFPF